MTEDASTLQVVFAALRVALRTHRPLQRTCRFSTVLGQAVVLYRWHAKLQWQLIV